MSAYLPLLRCMWFSFYHWHNISCLFPSWCCMQKGHVLLSRSMLNQWPLHVVEECLNWSIICCHGLKGSHLPCMEYMIKVHQISRGSFYQTRSAWFTDLWLIRKSFGVYKFAPTVRKVCHVGGLVHPLGRQEGDFQLIRNSVWPNGVIWKHKSGSTLAQVMACCLTSPGRYLNQCWLLIV